MERRNYKNCLSLIVVVVVVVVLAGKAEAQPVSRYCLLAEDPVFCTTLVKGTRSAVEATARAIKISIVVAKKTQPYVSHFVASLPKDLPPPLRNTVIDTCNKDYLEVLNNFMAALDYLYSGDINQLDIKMSSLPMENCLKGVEKAAVDPTAIKHAQEKLSKYEEYTKLIAKNVGPDGTGTPSKKP